MSSTPLQLEDYWVVDLSVRDLPVTAGARRTGRSASRATPRVDWTVYESKEGAGYLVRLKMAFGTGSPSALAGHIEVAGLFNVTVENEHAPALLNMNAPSILFGIARGIIGAVSATTMGGKYIVPAVNFVELAEKKRTRRRRPSSAAKSHVRGSRRS